MPDNKIIKDRRTYARISAYHLGKYRLITKPEQRPVVAAIRDIGGGGICLQVNEPVPVASILQLYINFPKISQPIPCLAKVIWTRKLNARGRFEVGLEFIDIEQIFRNAIVSNVDAVNHIET